MEPLGSDLMVHLTVDVPPIEGNEDVVELARESEDNPLEEAGDTTGMVARFSPRSLVREGAKVMVSVDTTRLHFFDAKSASAIEDNSSSN